MLGFDILTEQLNSSLFNNFAASSNILEESLKNILPDHLTAENDELRKVNGYQGCRSKISVFSIKNFPVFKNSLLKYKIAPINFPIQF